MLQRPVRLATIGLMLVAVAATAACRSDTPQPSPTSAAPTMTLTETADPVSFGVPPLEASLDLLELPADAIAPYTLEATDRYPVQDEPDGSELLAKMYTVGIVGGIVQHFTDETSRGMLSIHLLKRLGDVAELGRAAEATLAKSMEKDEHFDHVKIADHSLGEHASCMEYRSALQGERYLTHVCYLISRNVVAYLVLIVDAEDRDGLANASRIMAAVAERVNAAAVPGDE